MVDRGELKFVAKVIKRKSLSSSILLEKDTATPLYSINSQSSTIVEEPLSCLSTSFSNDKIRNITRNGIYPRHPLNNNNLRTANTYAHPRRAKAHSLSNVGSVDKFFFDSKQQPLEVFVLPNNQSVSRLSYISETIEEQERNRLRYSICGRELNKRISVSQMVFFWETVFLIGTRTARRYAGCVH